MLSADWVGNTKEKHQKIKKNLSAVFVAILLYVIFPTVKIRSYVILNKNVHCKEKKLHSFIEKYNTTVIHLK